MYNKSESDIDMTSVASYLKEAVTKVKQEENPDVLNDLKKIYKKNVPFTLRMYVAAYLVKEMSKNYKGNRNNRRDFHENRKNFNEKAPKEKKIFNTVETPRAPEEKAPRVRVQIDPNVAATIFISIGRNRRVFPRDLVGLLISVAGLERDRIGDIRVLANYSFVQLFAEDAEKTIAALNGYDYRGRKLAVSYSKQKDEESSEEMVDAEDRAAYAAAEKAAANKEPFSAPHISTEASGDYLV